MEGINDCDGSNGRRSAASLPYISAGAELQPFFGGVHGVPCPTFNIRGGQGRLEFREPGHF